MEFGDNSQDGQPSLNFNDKDLEMEVNFVFRLPKTKPTITKLSFFVQMYSEILGPISLRMSMKTRIGILIRCHQSSFLM